MNLDELRNLDLQNIASASGPTKAVVIGFLCVLALGAGVWFDAKPMYEQLQVAEAKEPKLMEEFTKKQAKAAKLPLLKQQLAEMEASFGALLRQLPESTEVESLLVDISQTALAAGLEIELFKPNPEIQKDFYAELPIQLKMTGTYHELATFVSGTAALPRIVTLHNIELHPKKKQKGSKDNPGAGGDLEMEATAKTYRYLEEG
jgi:type IV pilus assembly protein PilO